ncbi:hypothetical protein AQUCO_11400015v1 [Aquilegia coerulea]|uniref:Pseudouridine synthase I TruA alpha/beta domain-containing protein n=1 Tax=Aquilegia coerulea TaxID=218851 RepID=A0A2G5C2E3_AQUCA|nr:hypothetical protein AQUCO_11400015v1 [Aquilegia coerulea]
MAEGEIETSDFQYPISITKENFKSNGEGFIINLKNQLKTLENRVKELELENAKLSSQLSNCRCRNKLVENVNYYVAHGNTLIQESKKLSVGGEKVRLFPTKGVSKDVSHEDAVGHEEKSNVDETKEFESKERSPGCITKSIHHAPKRYVAMKIMYFGQRFYGFASQQVEPTIESEIFKALEKTRLLVCDKNESRYTRCGRTDKGVSSVGQVVSLLLRSKSGDTRVNGDHEKLSPEDMCGEIDYVRVLNGVLPKDIRVISWCPVRNDFHARFSCLRRTYKYLFWRGNLNLSEMEIAGMKFVGDHDFRNFCKMDAANVHNYRRHITSFEFSRCNSRSESDELWAMTIIGSAFLWHQIRCMVAVLFMIGHGLELPSVIDELLDINRTPRKPQYVMAPELPLILQSCEFERLKYICSPDASQSLREHLKNEIRHYELQAAIFQEALLSCSHAINDHSPSSHIKKKAAHIPLMSRPTEPSYEERQAKQKARTV